MFNEESEPGQCLLQSIIKSIRHREYIVSVKTASLINPLG